MLIQLKIKRPGGSKIEIGGNVYHFKSSDRTNPNGDHVCDVTDKDHIKRFMSIDAYEPYEADTVPAKADGSQVDDVPAVSDAYDAMDRDALAAEIESRTGKAPHHKTREANLRTALREIAATESAA